MDHCDKDLLYKFELKLLDEIETQNTSFHLKTCPKCSGLLIEIKNTVELLKSFEPATEVTSPPKMEQRKVKYSWIKRAAIIFFVMFIGYGGSKYFRTSDKVIIGQKLIPHNHSLDTLTFVNCENVDVYLNNYP